MQQVKRMQATLATNDMMWELKNRLDKFSEVEHMKRIKEFLIPKMESFACKIDEWTDNNR